jgi:hypothetical protein
LNTFFPKAEGLLFLGTQKHLGEYWKAVGDHRFDEFVLAKINIAFMTDASKYRVTPRSPRT